MNKKNILKLALVTTLLLTSITACTTAKEINTSTNKSDENIVLEKVETSSELLNSNDAGNSTLEKSEELEFDLSNIDNFKKFKIDAKALDYIDYSESNRENFEKIIRPLFDSNDVFSDEKVYNYDDFIENYMWDTTSTTGVYLSDVNNDGLNDLIVVYKNSGTANFAGISGVFLKTNTGYEIATFESEGEFVSNDVTLLNVNEKTYVCMTFGMLDEIYMWDENSLLKIADEDEFVDNSHISKDKSLINSDILKEYEIDKKVIDLASSGISYSNSGYSDEEILVSYYKIKKFIELEDKEEVADLVMFPVTFMENDKYIKVYNRKQFIENYDKIITDDIKSAVSTSTYKDIFSSWRGAMLGNGEVWFTNYIIAIN